MSCRGRNDEKRTLRSPTMMVEVPLRPENDKRLRKRFRRPSPNIMYVNLIASSFPSLAHVGNCRGRSDQTLCYRCTQTRRLHNRSRRKTNRYGTIREIWPCLDVCWMRNREVKSLRILLGWRNGLDPASFPECWSPSSYLSTQIVLHRKPLFL